MPQVRRCYLLQPYLVEFRSRMQPILQKRPRDVPNWFPQSCDMHAAIELEPLLHNFPVSTSGNHDMREALADRIPQAVQLALTKRGTLIGRDWSGAKRMRCGNSIFPAVGLLLQAPVRADGETEQMNLHASPRRVTFSTHSKGTRS